MALISLTVLWTAYSEDLFLSVLRDEYSASDKALSALSRGNLICLRCCAPV